MPVIRIMDMDGNVVFEGEGDIELNSDPDPSAPARARIVQTEPRPEGSVHRAMEVQGGVDGLGPMSFEMEFAALPFLLAPAADPSRRPPPPSVERQTLRVGGNPSAVAYLGRELNQQIETPEERRARMDAEREEFRRAAQVAGHGLRRFLDDARPEGARDIMQAIPPPDQFSTPEALAVMAEGAAQTVVGLSAFREAVQQMAEGFVHQAEMARRFGMDPGPDPAHDELIESTRAAFPPDPHNYGYPGEGSSRWTPPADPEEKIRSCP